MPLFPRQKTHSARRVRNVIVWTLCLSLFGSKALTQAQSISATHLVGHEETALLLRVQDVIDDWDPRKLVNPYVETSTVTLPDGQRRVSKQLKRPDLAEFIADVEAAEALGKAFFWEMQAGSDFRRTEDGTYVGTACASCHYRNGADSRNRNTVRIPYVAWNEYKQDPAHPLEFGEKPLPFDIKSLATRDFALIEYQHAGPFSLIVGSQGVEPRGFEGFPDKSEEDATGVWESEMSAPRPVQDKAGWSKPEWSMFYEGQSAEGGFHSRQITNRNSPSVINSTFADRLFHDGRAESTFNGFSIFGDADPREVIHRRRDYIERDPAGTPQAKSDVVHVRVAINKAALASQAVGPIVNEVEMSYLGRTFPNLAKKLLDRQILKYQIVDANDSLLGPLDGRLNRDAAGLVPAEDRHLVGAIGRKSYTYRELIKRAFKPEWWDWNGLDVPLVLLRSSAEDGDPHGHLMEANFSLYWGLSILLYEASLVSNHTPFDEMLRGNSQLVEKKWDRVKDRIGNVYLDSAPPEKQSLHKNGTSVFQHGFRVFMDRGCVECHSGPLMSELYDRLPEDTKQPIGHTLERVLLPNSKADAIAIVKQTKHDSTLSEIASRVALVAPKLKTRAANIARELDLLRERASKDPEKLEKLVESHLQGILPDGSRFQQTDAAAIATLLISYEKAASQPLGNRPFFSEAERVPFAEQIADPVLVEKMVIPPKQQRFRPPFPIAGLKEKGYAFYDLGFYNLGVAPPRYDRGIGDAALENQKDAVENALTLLESSSDRTDRTAGRNARSAIEAPKDSKDVESKLAAIADKLPAELNAKFAQAVKMVEELQQADAAKRRNTSSSPGSAYQFRQEWFRMEFKSPKSILADDETKARSLEAPGKPSRSASQGPQGNLDKDFWDHGPYTDTSWDRIDIADDRRRSELKFKSRARELVVDETVWGYRKPLMHDNELAYWGSFKTPSLRNVELTAPYMHNGRFMTLGDVIEFYEHAGDELDDEIEDAPDPLRFVPRDRQFNPDKHPAIVSLKLSISDRRALEFFLLCLTDDRVRSEQAPFDHPSLQLVNGYTTNGPQLKDAIKSINATGQAGTVEELGLFPSEK